MLSPLDATLLHDATPSRSPVHVRCVAVVCLGAFLAFGMAASAQNDPFFVPQEELQLGPADTRNPDADSGPPDTPLSEQLKLRARRGGLAAVESVSSLARIGRWEDVDRLLTDLAGRQFGEAALAQMGSQIDPAVMIRIRLSDRLSDTSRAFIERMSVASKSASESPDRLRAAIKKMGAKSRDQQIAGLRELRSGGQTAVVELVRAIVAKEPVAPRDDLLRALLSFGPGGLESLRQIALYGQPELRERALDAVVRMAGLAAIPELVTALHAADSTDGERNIAALHLVSLGVTDTNDPLVSRDVAVQTLRGDLRRKRQVAGEISWDDRIATMWSLNEDREGVVFQDVPAVLKPYRDASDAAARLRRVGLTSAATTHDALGSDLGYRLMVDADWGDVDQLQSIRTAYPSLTTPEGLSAAIENSLEKHNTAAVVGLVRLVSSLTQSPDSLRMLHQPSSQVSPLVRAVDHPSARIRFEAAAAIASMPGAGHYSGSSRVRRTLSEMRSLGDRPTALLLETRPDVTVRQEGLLSRLGYDVAVVGSAAELERRVAAGGDLRLILAKTEIADMTAVEMVDRVRRSPRGRNLPILLYGHPSPGLDTDRWPAPEYPASTVLIDRPATVTGLNQILDAATGYRQLPMLSSLDRQRYRQIATDALADLAESR